MVGGGGVSLTTLLVVRPNGIKILVDYNLIGMLRAKSYWKKLSKYIQRFLGEGHKVKYNVIILTLKWISKSAVWDFEKEMSGRAMGSENNRQAGILGFKEGQGQSKNKLLGWNYFWEDTHKVLKFF